MLTADELLRSPPQSLTTVGDFIRYANSIFNRANLSYGQGTENAYDEAIWLVLRAVALEFDQIERFWNCQLEPIEKQFIFELIQKRVRHRIPTAYLLNEAWLGNYSFYVDERTIIPRSYLAELLLNNVWDQWLKPPENVRTVLELCTGSGCLAILAALSYPNALIDAVDISPEALEVAKLNVAQYQMQEQINLLNGDLYSPLYDPTLPPSHLYDLILCNPPYVNDESMANLPPEFLHEPHIALAGGHDGMKLIDTIIRKAAHFLKPDGILVLELGHEKQHFESRYPQLNPVWLACQDNNSAVLLLDMDQLSLLES